MISFPVPHFNDRPAGVRPEAIVLHDTGGHDVEGTLAWFRDPKSKVSAHYVVDLEGDVYRCVPDEKRAWHAGASVLFGRENVNDFSLGIELVDDDDREGYTRRQWNAAINLVTELCREYAIPLNHVVGHCHVAVPRGRKVDPGPDFDWVTFLTAVAHRSF